MPEQPYIIVPKQNCAYALEDGDIFAYPLLNGTHVPDFGERYLVTNSVFAVQRDLVEAIQISLEHIHERTEETFEMNTI